MAKQRREVKNFESVNSIVVHSTWTLCTASIRASHLHTLTRAEREKNHHRRMCLFLWLRRFWYAYEVASTVRLSWWTEVWVSYTSDVPFDRANIMRTSYIPNQRPYTMTIWNFVYVRAAPSVGLTTLSSVERNETENGIVDEVYDRFQLYFSFTFILVAVLGQCTLAVHDVHDNVDDDDDAIVCLLPTILRIDWLRQFTSSQWNFCQIPKLSPSLCLCHSPFDSWMCMGFYCINQTRLQLD